MSILVSALIISSVFQAAAIANLGGSAGYPIPFFYAMEAFVLFGSALYYYTKHGIYVLHEDNKRALIAFFFLSCVSVVLGPLLFKGLLVYNPRLGIDAQVEQQSALQLNMSMIGQLMYLALNTSVYVSICGARNINCLRIHTAIKATTLLLLTFACWQFAHNIIGIYYPTDIVYSNIHGALEDKQIFSNGIERLSATFFEPSYFGLFCAALATYFLIVTRRLRSYNFLLHLACALACVICTASTGLVALAVGYGIFGTFRIRRLSRHSFRLFISVISVICVCCLVATAVSYPYLKNVITAQLLDKTSSLSYAHRSMSNWFALGLIQHTFGLGVGLGGNRPSSFALYLLSNVGIAGTAVFAYFVYSHVHGRVGSGGEWRLDEHEPQLAARAALLTTVGGMCLSVPDLSLPQLWMWIFVVLALSGARTNPVGGYATMRRRLANKAGGLGVNG